MPPAGPPRRPARVWSLLLALFLLLAAPACGGDDDPAGGTGGGEAASTQEGAPAGDGDAETGDGEDTGGATEGSGDAGGDGGAGSADARFNLVASPDNAECSYVPNGHQSRADLLNVHFFFLIIGGNPPDVPLLRVNGSSDTGLSTSFSAGPHNQSVTTAQFALRPGDFGRTHTIAITVDASNQVTETDESDNRIRVSVALPSPRPSNAIDPLSCSVSRG